MGKTSSRPGNAPRHRHATARGARIKRCSLVLLQAAVVLLVTSPRGTAQNTATRDGARGDSASSLQSNEEAYETLRKLLGLPVVPPPTLHPAATPLPPPAAVVEPPPLEETAEPVVEPTAKKVRTAAPKPAPAKKSPASPTKPSAVSPSTIPEATVVETPAPPPPASKPVVTVELPPAGTVVSSANVDRWDHLLGPSIRWAIEHGAKLDVIENQPAPMEPSRLRATERYSAQVKLSADKLSMENYVAGIPFPTVTPDDPDVAIKLMFNFEARAVHDDTDLRKSACDTGSLSSRGMRLEKHYLSDHFRRLFYVSRLREEPMPTWHTTEGVRYREMTAGLIEPFDLKGAGYTYARYLTPSRQDDSWVYYPMSRRVRRLSTAQRSDGLFGTDIDLDSFAGYSGNPAWVDWKFLGTKTILASLHARRFPAKYEDAPADFFPDDVWEPREVYILVGTPKIEGGVFGRRVLYIDKESLMIPYAELYDLKGGLWKSLVFTWRYDNKPKPDAKRAVYDEKMAYNVNFSLFDMQLGHATRCETPSHEDPNEEGFYFNFGDKEGNTEEVFSVAGVIGEAR